MTTPLTLRAVKGSPLTHDEVDENFVAVRNRADATQQLLTATLDLYVRTDGNDANSGMANTAGSAVLTIQRALDIAAGFDTSSFGVVINVADGTYNEAVMRSYGGQFRASFDVEVIGNVTTPANVVFTGGFFASLAGFYRVAGVTFLNHPVIASTSSELHFDNCVFNASQINCYLGALQINQNVTVTGNGASALYAWRGTMFVNYAITVTGTPAYTTGFAWAEAGGNIDAYAAPTGAATGPRYNCNLNGIINTYGGGANFFPGNAAGTTATGGQYA